MNGKTIIGILTAAVLSCTALLSLPKITKEPLHASAEDGRLYNQWDPKWKEYTWDGYSTTGNSMYTSACGIFSFCNAIYGLNSIAPDAVEVAQWAYEIKAFRPGGGGTYRDLLYAGIEEKFGEKFHFTLGQQYFGTVTQKAAIDHLKTGGVIVLHVPGHFIAVTGYNEKDQTYHVIESAVSASRNLEPDSWVSGQKLSEGGTKGQWFILISNTKAPGRASVSLNSGIDYAGANEIIDLAADSDTRNYFALGINDMEGKRLNTLYIHDEALSNRQHFRTQLPVGDYSCYVTGANAFGMIDSPDFVFHVYEGAPESADFTVSAKKGSVGTPLDLTVSGNLSTEQRVTIRRGGEVYQEMHHVRVLKDTSAVDSWTPELPGEYEISAEISNSYGKLNPAPVSLTVIGDVPVTFDAAGGTVPEDEAVINMTYLGKYGTLPAPKRDYWSFDGWFTEPEGGQQVTAKTKVSNPDAHTLYAHWTKIYQKGDINVDEQIDTTDAQLVLRQYLAKLANRPADPVDPNAAAAADVDGSGTLSLEDAQFILMYYVRNTLAHIPTDWETLCNMKYTVTTTEPGTTATSAQTTAETKTTAKSTAATNTTAKTTSATKSIGSCSRFVSDPMIRE